jgi:hypothetical protein
MNDLSDESLDAMLRDAMQSRPLPEPIPNLAARAMSLARRSADEAAALERRLARVNILRRRVQFASALAACLLSTVLFVGYRALPSDFSLFGTTTSTSSETASDSTASDSTATLDSTTTSTESSTTSYALLGIGILVITALGMAVGGSLRTPAIRFDGPFVPSLR